MVNKITTPPTQNEVIDKINELVDDKQDTLVSGTNIKTINGTSLLGSGNIDIQGGGSTYTAGDGIDITNNVISVDGVSTSEVTLATVATSGSSNDLSNKPTIPTVNNATLTIQKNGSNVATFTANASSNITANISVPTNTNELTNGAGFITSSALSGYQTTANLVTSVSSSSTDSQYPSAKLFYDTVGNIETLLAAI